MPSRRHLLTSLAGICTVAGCLGSSQRGNVQLSNQTDRELFVRLTIRTRGGSWSDERTVFSDGFRLFPTRGQRVTLTDVAPPGTYDVEFAGVPDAYGGPHTTRWRPDGDPGESLIVSVGPDFGVEFYTQ